MAELALVMFIELAVATGSTIVAGIITGAVLVAVNLAVASILGKLLAPSLDKNARGGKGVQSNVKSNIEPRKTIYGEAVVGGPFVIMESSGIETWDGVAIHNKELRFLIALAGRICW